jgi:hypothetical protein
MQERPIPFSPAMVASLLAGTKTQTRRVLAEAGVACDGVRNGTAYRIGPGGETIALSCPYGAPGDRLRVEGPGAIVLEITSIHAERLGRISVADALAEGVETGDPDARRDPIASYRTLWDSLNLRRGFGWSTDPWVWVIAFRRLF